MLRYVVLATLLGCSSGPVVEPVDAHPEQAQRALARAVDELVAAGRTPAAYRDFATAARATIGLDPRIAADVERRLVTLALAPASAVANSAVETQADHLALTVWPTLLASDAAMPGESASAYLERVCREQEALACGATVPELRAYVVAARAADNALARTAQAIADCDECNDDGWREIRRGWEAIARSSRSALADIEHRSRLQAWPIAGAAAVRDDRAPDIEIEVAANELVFDGYRYASSVRVPVLRDARARGTLAFYMHPDAPLRQLTSLLRDAREAGLATITLIAREPAAPWGRTFYTISTSTPVPMRVDAPVQAFLRDIDSRSVSTVSGSVSRLDGA